MDGINNATRLGFQVPTSTGGITITNVALEQAGTGTYRLVTLSNVGTPAVNGSVTTTAFGGTVTAGVVVAATIADGWVAGGEWVGVTETNIGTPTRARISISYVMGR
jgi:hypothetical protein